MAVGSSGLPSVSAGETEEAAADEVLGDLAASDEEDEEVPLPCLFRHAV